MNCFPSVPLNDSEWIEEQRDNWLVTDQPKTEKTKEEA
jgi:hypothetical protein